MADTIVNTMPPATQTDNHNNSGILLAVVVLALILLFALYVLPVIRNIGTVATSPNVSVQVPKQVDVNVNPNK